MKFNKTIAVLTLVAGSLLAETTSHAQTTPTNHPPAAQVSPGGAMTRRPNLDKMVKDLGLDETQATKFKAAMDEQMQAIRALRAATNSTPEKTRVQGKAIRDNTTAKIKAILTPEQFAKYEEMMPGLRRGPAGGPPKAAEKPAKAKKE